ncbi:D-alanyl-D-alanine carboxypeptidase [Erythrobacter sp. KY5]|uniref:D-alanyl-D-alanine carboxypeptidase family protein n=1 Tax=Erythrobacter sp. KY5 TaxID=2011159 RepID=UPI000DBEF3BD|nr:D-alanyl-D-alanine carboxypeptidase family protein [Erythrobacter sp. KY5]AWW74779.1 D-alanyl-D-alanine carboxypeptidase [Erythrobacter sp. KY5]
MKRSLAVLVAVGLVVAAQTGRAQTPAPVPAQTELPIALLVDVTSGQVLYSRNAERRFVPASITKVMTLFHAFELIEEGTLDPRQTLVMSDEVWEAWNGEGSTMSINAGDSVAVDDLLTGIANISANDGSVMLAEGQAGSVGAWLDGMNQRARSLGMVNSHFGTPNGWPDEGRTFTTASDLVKLAQALVRRHPQKYARYVGRPGFRYNDIEQFNRDPMIGRVPGADGIKTGYTNESGLGYVGSAKRDGQRLVVVVAGISRGSIRARAARDLIEWGFGAFERERLFAQGEIVGNARVQGGSSRTVALMTERNVFVNVPSGRLSDVSLRIEYDGPLRAPFTSGDRVATLAIEVPGMEPARLPLLAAESVETAGFFTRIYNGIAGWFS